MYHPEANNTGYERLNQITKPENRYYVEPRIVQISTDPEVSAISYKRFDDLDINILEIYDRIRNEAYFIKAKMPLAEVTRVAQSMFSK